MKKTFLPAVFLIFILLSALFFLLKAKAPSFRFPVLMGGNILMLLLSLVSFMLVSNNLHKGASAFVRGVYSATFLKLMVCMAGILVYALLNRQNIHKPTLFALFGIYLIYTAVETWLLSKKARQVH